MTIIEHEPTEEEILDFIDNSIRQLQEAGASAQFVVVGPSSYERLNRAVSRRFRRGKGAFETYAHLPVVVDPSRENQVVVLPSASDTASEANLVSAS